MSEPDPLISSLYHETARREPPAQLDARILAQARRDVSAEPRPVVSPPWWRRLALPISALAVAGLTVAVSLIMERERESERAYAPAPPAAAPAEKQATPGASAPPVSATVQEFSRQERPAERTPRPTAPSRQREAAPIEESGRGSAAKEALSEPSIRQADESVAATKRSTDTAPAPAAIAPAPPAAAGTAAPPAAPAMTTPRDEAESRLGKLESKAQAGRVGDAPELWLDRIRALKREGREQDAAALLTQFRSRFPDYPLPEDLR